MKSILSSVIVAIIYLATTSVVISTVSTLNPYVFMFTSLTYFLFTYNIVKAIAGNITSSVELYKSKKHEQELLRVKNSIDNRKQSILRDYENLSKIFSGDYIGDITDNANIIVNGSDMEMISSAINRLRIREHELKNIISVADRPNYRIINDMINNIINYGYDVLYYNSINDNPDI